MQHDDTAIPAVDNLDMEHEVPSTVGPNMNHIQQTLGPFMNRARRREVTKGGGRKTKMSKDYQTLITPAMQAKGAFGKPHGKMAYVTKYSDDMHKWVEPKKSKKPTRE